MMKATAQLIRRILSPVKYGSDRDSELLTRNNHSPASLAPCQSKPAKHRPQRACVRIFFQSGFNALHLLDPADHSSFRWSVGRRDGLGRCPRLKHMTHCIIRMRGRSRIPNRFLRSTCFCSLRRWSSSKASLGREGALNGKRPAKNVTPHPFPVGNHQTRNPHRPSFSGAQELDTRMRSLRNHLKRAGFCGYFGVRRGG